MAVRRKSAKAIKAEMEALQAQLREAKSQEEADAGRLARKAGLLDLDLTDDELLKAFEEVASSFRRKAGQASGSGAAPHTADRGSAAADAAE